MSNKNEKVDKDNSNETDAVETDQVNKKQKLNKKDDENEKLKAKLAETENDYLRAQAEIQNMQKANHKEQASLAKYGAQKLANDIIPVVDDLKRALKVKVDDDAGEQLKSGIEMVYKHLDKALKDNDIVEINAAGEKFNPELHQAVQTVPADKEHPADTVVQVLQTGYKLADRVIRPAMVVVSQ